MRNHSPPGIDVRALADGALELRLSGEWTLGALAESLAALQQHLARHASVKKVNWNCLNIAALDSTGAMLLWRAWRRSLPQLLQASPEQLAIFERIAAADRERSGLMPASQRFAWLLSIGTGALRLFRHVSDFTSLIGRLLLDIAYLVRHPSAIPWREISANMYKSGVRSMPVTALVGFLIGVVLSFLSALQLRNFGADIYIINIVGLGIIRELGPLLVAVLVAGRSGSAMTAQLGVMRVTDEIDALAAMGVSRSQRLILPKVVALAVTMPLLVLWTTAIALIGGMVSAQIQLDISYGYFIATLPRAVAVSNLWIGLSKGLVFGILVGLIACHFGLRVRPNTESLSANTTASVVTAITLVILADAVFAIVMREIGLRV